MKRRKEKGGRKKEKGEREKGKGERRKRRAREKGRREKGRKGRGGKKRGGEGKENVSELLQLHRTSKLSFVLLQQHPRSVKLKVCMSLWERFPQVMFSSKSTGILQH